MAIIQAEVAPLNFASEGPYCSQFSRKDPSGGRPSGGCCWCS